MPYSSASRRSLDCHNFSRTMQNAGDDSRAPHQRIQRAAPVLRFVRRAAAKGAGQVDRRRATSPASISPMRMRCRVSASPWSHASPAAAADAARSHSTAAPAGDSAARPNINCFVMGNLIRPLAGPPTPLIDAFSH